MAYCVWRMLRTWPEAIRHEPWAGHSGMVPPPLRLRSDSRSFDRVVPERLAPGEALLEAMPMADLRLAQTPAQVDLLLSPPGQKVHQALVQVLDHAAQGFDFTDSVVDFPEEPGALRLGPGVAAPGEGPAGAAGQGAECRQLLLVLAKIHAPGDETTHQGLQAGEQVVGFS